MIVSYCDLQNIHELLIMFLNQNRDGYNFGSKHRKIFDSDKLNELQVYADLAERATDITGSMLVEIERGNKIEFVCEFPYGEKERSLK